jgi:hypothetical protein
MSSIPQEPTSNQSFIRNGILHLQTPLQPGETIGVDENGAMTIYRLSGDKEVVHTLDEEASDDSVMPDIQYNLDLTEEQLKALDNKALAIFIEDARQALSRTMEQAWLDLIKQHRDEREALQKACLNASRDFAIDAQRLYDWLALNESLSESRTAEMMDELIGRRDE